MPVARPVSASSRKYRSRVYLRSSVEVSEVEPNVAISPAACQVGARGQPVALQQDDVPDAQVRQVVGDRRADDAAADDHDPGAIGQAAGWSLAWLAGDQRLARSGLRESRRWS